MRHEKFGVRRVLWLVWEVTRLRLKYSRIDLEVCEMMGPR